MSEIGSFRLVILRVFYFLVASSFISLASFDSLYNQINIEILTSIIKSVLFAAGLLALIGTVQPTRMLPLLLLSVFWKTMFLAGFVMPAYLSDQLTPEIKSMLLPMSIGFLVTLAVIPWRYVIDRIFTLKIHN